MRLHKSIRFWRRGQKRRVVRAPKLNSKLVKLEREIGGVADHIAGNTDRPPTTGAPRTAVASFFRAAGQEIAAAITYNWRQFADLASSARRLVTIAVRPATQVYPPAMPASTKRRVAPKTVKPASTGTVSLSLVSICFGLLIVSGVIIALLFLQIKDMKGEIARWQQNLSATQAQLRQVEKTAQQKVDREVKAAATRARHVPIALTTDESKAVRASIKVIPSKSGTQSKTRVGDEVTDPKSAAVPESLTIQIPKLRGARFSIDDNGAIVLFAEGSNRVDAVIEPQ